MNMKTKSGQTAVELVIILAIVLVIGAGIFGIFNKYVFGNRQIIDLKQNFNVAYVLGDNGKFERIKIKSWKDWKDSDAVQVIKDDGTPVYTHLMNVKLVHE